MKPCRNIGRRLWKKPARTQSRRPKRRARTETPPGAGQNRSRMTAAAEPGRICRAERIPARSASVQCCQKKSGGMPARKTAPVPRRDDAPVLVRVSVNGMSGMQAAGRSGSSAEMRRGGKRELPRLKRFGTGEEEEPIDLPPPDETGTQASAGTRRMRAPTA